MVTGITAITLRIELFPLLLLVPGIQRCSRCLHPCMYTENKYSDMTGRGSQTRDISQTTAWYDGGMASLIAPSA